ncbi:MAG: M60 family metallopeptidase [Kiritimatiellae bacterium]|nr:M60 family metallopeptidase [Kiritimatiellia bacterium]
MAWRCVLTAAAVHCDATGVRATPASRPVIPAPATAEELPTPPPQWPRSAVPGELVVFGPRSRVWLTGRRDGVEVPMGAVAEAGRGRVVALAHDGFLPGAAAAPGSSGWLMALVRWVAGAAAHSRPLRVATVGWGGAERVLQAGGGEVVALEPTGAVSSEVVIAVGRRIPIEAIEKLAAHVEGGGGLIIAETAWSWTGDGRRLSEHPANRLCARWGILWTAETCEFPLSVDHPPTAGASLTHAFAAFNALESGAARSQLPQATAILNAAIRWLPDDDTLLRPLLDEKLGRCSWDPPVPARPAQREEWLRRAAITWAMRGARARRPHDVRALPGVDVFPGAVPPEADRSRRELVLDLSPEGWVSTGLYVPPGEPVRIELEAEAQEARLTARIGAHTDRLWQLDEWRRYPEISCAIQLTNSFVTVASPFGGLLYLERAGPAPRNALRVRVSGAVEAPLFRRGITPPEDWQRSRQAPAPWGELVGRRVILTLPSDRLRGLEDPEGLMESWDRVLDACAELAGRPAERARPERIVPDVQISAGYMHSGYPIMTHADQYEVLVSRAAVLQGQWGLFHELGHNHQEPDWTFEGTAEVTVNLFTLYVLETVCGRPPLTGHPQITPQAQRRLWQRYVAGGRRFEDWKREPFLALGMYMQLRAAFGWEPFRRVFAEYRALPRAERPRTDEECRDQWLVRLSRSVGRNLGPWFEAWGVPTSAAARARVAELPPWMPESWSPAEREAAPQR